MWEQNGKVNKNWFTSIPSLFANQHHQTRSCTKNELHANWHMRQDSIGMLCADTFDIIWIWIHWRLNEDEINTKRNKLTYKESKMMIKKGKKRSKAIKQINCKTVWKWDEGSGEVKNCWEVEIPTSGMLLMIIKLSTTSHHVSTSELAIFLLITCSFECL